ncbi:hypothetical protein ABTO66_19235, partial [Acinetobacter baumannii]
RRKINLWLIKVANLFNLSHFFITKEPVGLFGCFCCQVLPHHKSSRRFVFPYISATLTVPGVSESILLAHLNK